MKIERNWFPVAHLFGLLMCYVFILQKIFYKSKISFFFIASMSCDPVTQNAVLLNGKNKTCLLLQLTAFYGSKSNVITIVLSRQATPTQQCGCSKLNNMFLQFWDAQHGYACLLTIGLKEHLESRGHLTWKLLGGKRHSYESIFAK